MDEGPIPGARVRATTKHGALTVDESAAMQPGMARLMDELSRRYWTLFYAAKARNWELANYMAKEAQKVLRPPRWRGRNTRRTSRRSFATRSGRSRPRSNR